MDLPRPGISPDDLRFARNWRLRNAALYDFLKRHNATIEQIARGFFPGRTMATRKKRASRWLAKQRRRGRVRVVGVVQRRDTGRPEIVYGKKCSPERLAHEVAVAELELLLDVELMREAKVGRTQADAVAIISKRKWFMEVDNSAKMTAKQMQAKWERYQGVTDYILVVAMTESRMQRLRKGAERVKTIAMFSTFDRLRSGVPEPLVDWYGKAAPL